MRVLAGPKWFSDSELELGDKDGYQALVGVWIYELGELHALGKRDVARVKAFVSAPADRYRPSYGRRSILVPRQTVFVGTTNASQYLGDETGGRRFNPIKCGRIDLAKLTQDRDQLWAEARHRFDKGEAWHMTGALAKVAAEEQEERFVRDPWEERVAAWLANPEREDVGVTTADVLAALHVDTGKQGKTEAMRVAAILRRLGWTRRQERVGDDRRYVYRRNPEKQAVVTTVTTSAGDDDEGGDT